MAQLLARMERDGLIHREPSPDDRRRSLGFVCIYRSQIMAHAR
ncbi:MarR family transcriptional regulator [Facivitalis istanbulensis]